MHRPGLAEVAETATRHFFPIERLREIRFIDPSTPSRDSPRESAIAAALEGNLDEARTLIAAGAEPIDLKYQANLESLTDDEKRLERAASLYLRALREDPNDPWVIGWLLDYWRKSKSKAVASVLRQDAVLAPVLETLDRDVHDTPGDARLWRRLEALFALQEGDHPQARQFAERAAVLERTGMERSRAIGRVFSAATYRFAGRITGLIHEVWATREMAPEGQGGALRRDDILGNLTHEMRESVRSNFLAVREYAQAKFPHLTRDILNYSYGYKVTKEDEPSGGTSAGLPTALAFLSVFLQRPLAPNMASTGMLVTDAHDVLTVRAVGDIEFKVDGAYHRNLTAMLIPSGNRPILEHSGIVPRVIREGMVRYVSDLDEAVRIAFDGDKDL
jgi:tetratricopeptide (TPR) repeat protein